MKKIILMALLAILLSASFVYAKVAIIGPITTLTGGGVNSLDGIECEDILNDNSNRAIATNDVALCIVSNTLMIYQYDSTGSDSEEDNGPNDPIVPDDRADCGGAGQWNLLTAMTFGRSATPQTIYRDSDCTDNDDNVYWTMNCTDTGSGSEDCDITLYVQIDGNATAVLTVDADGYIGFPAHDINLGAGQVYRINGTDLAAVTQTLTNKTLDANGTGNTIKGYGYITFTKPHNRGSATGAVGTTETDNKFGVPYFADDVETNNYVDYICEVPRDIDTSVDLVAWFKFMLGGADTADHDYIISMVSIADSAAAAGSPGNAINLSYNADASGAEGDIETAGGDTLTDWKSNVTAGQFWLIRITRDGDDGTNDASTVDSYPMELTIRYGFTQ